MASGSMEEEARACMSLPYAYMNPKAVAYVAGKDNNVACACDKLNIFINPKK